MTKAKFVESLVPVLRAADSTIADLVLSPDEKTVHIQYASGYKRPVNVAGDSNLAILKDVLNQCSY